jgi:hypothetical protein
LGNGGAKSAEDCIDCLATGGSYLVAVRAGDFGDQSVSPEQAELVADPGGATAKLLFVVGNHGKEDGAEIAIAEAALSHKRAVHPRILQPWSFATPYLHPVSR